MNEALVDKMISIASRSLLSDKHVYCFEIYFITGSIKKKNKLMTKKKKVVKKRGLHVCFGIFFIKFPKIFYVFEDGGCNVLLIKFYPESLVCHLCS